jgi:hypothetical protein
VARSRCILHKSLLGLVIIGMDRTKVGFLVRVASLSARNATPFAGRDMGLERAFAPEQFMPLRFFWAVWRGATADW